MYLLIIKLPDYNYLIIVILVRSWFYNVDFCDLLSVTNRFIIYEIWITVLHFNKVFSNNLLLAAASAIFFHILKSTLNFGEILLSTNLLDLLIESEKKEIIVSKWIINFVCRFTICRYSHHCIFKYPHQSIRANANIFAGGWFSWIHNYGFKVKCHSSYFHPEAKEKIGSTPENQNNKKKFK